MRLSPCVRRRLAERLIASLDGEKHADAEELWAEEVERRDDDFRSSRVKGVPATTVFRKARSALR